MTAAIRIHSMGKPAVYRLPLFSKISGTLATMIFLIRKFLAKIVIVTLVVPVPLLSKSVKFRFVTFQVRPFMLNNFRHSPAETPIAYLWLTPVTTPCFPPMGANKGGTNLRLKKNSGTKCHMISPGSIPWQTMPRTTKRLTIRTRLPPRMSYPAVQRCRTVQHKLLSVMSPLTTRRRFTPCHRFTAM